MLQCIFKKHIPITDFPSHSTCNNILDRAHILSKYQVGEQMMNCEKWDLRGDGTTRDYVKIIGQQVTLNTGSTLSTGFRQVHVEDINTLLDNAICMMDELSDVYNDCEKEVVFKALF